MKEFVEMTDRAFKRQFGEDDGSVPPLETIHPRSQDYGDIYATDGIDTYAEENEVLPTVDLFEVENVHTTDEDKKRFGFLTSRIFRGKPMPSIATTPRWKKDMYQRQKRRNEARGAGSISSIVEEVSHVDEAIILRRPMDSSQRFPKIVARFFVTFTINGITIGWNMMTVSSQSLQRYFYKISETMSTTSTLPLINVNVYLNYSKYFVWDDTVQLDTNDTSVLRSPDSMTDECVSQIYCISSMRRFRSVDVFWASRVTLTGVTIYDVPIIYFYMENGERSSIYILTGASDPSGWHLEPKKVMTYVDTTCATKQDCVIDEGNIFSSRSVPSDMCGGKKREKLTFDVKPPPFPASRLALNGRK